MLATILLARAKGLIRLGRCMSSFVETKCGSVSSFGVLSDIILRLVLFGVS
jgi:hypothetical protein